LFDCTEALLEIEGSSVNEIFGFPDDMKLKSSMTLFDAVPRHSPSIFKKYSVNILLITAPLG
jgi:uncharacterized protein (DUF1810 family)